MRAGANWFNAVRDYECGRIQRIRYHLPCQYIGGNYTVLHNFDLLTGDGAVGESTLTAVNSTLYGTTLFGGAYGTELNGIIFKINADGSGYTIMHSFGGAGDGSISSGDLVDSGSILYGACQAGGTGAGTIFKINTDGSGYATLYSFSGGTKSTGPAGGLTLVGSTLYGTTFHGGSHGDGNIFSIDTNGSGYKDLYDFTGGTDGEQPFGTMATDGSFLYGVDDYGGTDYSGVLFRVGLNGSGFTVLHDTYGGSFTGQAPTLVGSTLYCPGGGIAVDGGQDIFQINTNGTGYKELYDFNSDTISSNDDLLVSGSTLYDMTQYGGANECGSVFGLTLPANTTPEPGTFPLLATCAIAFVGYRWGQRTRRWSEPVAVQPIASSPAAPAILSFPSQPEALRRRGDRCALPGKPA